MFKKFLAHLRQQSLGALALFIVLGGTSYAVAAGSIDSREIKNNTVASKDIRNNQVTSSDVRNGSLLDRDFKRGQLPAGPVGPRGPAGTPPTVAAPTEVTAFLNGWTAYTGNAGPLDDTPVRVRKDLSGTVHLEGALTKAGPVADGSLMFSLPPGYRPAAHHVNVPVVTTGPNSGDTNEELGYLQILGDCCGAPSSGNVVFYGGNPGFVSLDGITFRAAP